MGMRAGCPLHNVQHVGLRGSNFHSSVTKHPQNSNKTGYGPYSGYVSHVRSGEAAATDQRTQTMTQNIVPANLRRNAIARLNRRRDANIVLAGERFDWVDAATGKGIGGSPAGASKYGNARNGLRVLVWEAQDGLCAACGHGVALTDMEVAHIVGNNGSPSKSRGYVAGNVYGSHAVCNADDFYLFGDVVPPASLARPDVVSLAYWTRADMLAADATFAARVSAMDAAGREARLMRRKALAAQG